MAVVVVAGIALAVAGWDSFHFSSTDLAEWQTATARPLLYGAAVAVAAGVAALSLRVQAVAWAAIGVAVAALVVGFVARNDARNPWGDLRGMLDRIGPPPGGTLVATADTKGDSLEVPTAYRLFSSSASPDEVCKAMLPKVRQATQRQNVVAPDMLRVRKVTCAVEAFDGDRRVHLRVAPTADAVLADLGTSGMLDAERLPKRPGTAVAVDVSVR